MIYGEAQLQRDLRPSPTPNGDVERGLRFRKRYGKNYRRLEVSEMARSIPHPFASLLLCAAVAGCASTKVSDRQILVTERLPRPDRILVYDFAAPPADIPPDAGIAGQ